MRDITNASGVTIKEYLDSTVGAVFKSATIDADTVTTVDSDNNKYLNKGVVIARITSPASASGLVGPYDEDATDGRQLDGNILGINDTFADLSNGDVEVGYLTHGVVKESKIVMGSKDGDLPDSYKSLLRTATMDITFNE
ncbi:MAG TPA: hypothetical protein ENJ27_00680 [Candidatus Moranbacteria bacterium]|nr:hypothetical protein [Candidatus Moranbacteria bacterium]